MLIVGILIGAVVGIFFNGLCHISSDGDDDSEFMAILEHERQEAFKAGYLKGSLEAMNGGGHGKGN